MPDGINVNFSCDSLGTVNPLNNTTVNGVTTTIFTGNSPGVSVVRALVDSQNVTTNVSIVTPTAIQTAITVTPTTGYKGIPANLIATLRDTKNNLSLAGKTIRFSVNGTFLGTALTNSGGVATLPYIVLENIGVYPILAEFIQDATYAANNGTANLTVATNIADVEVTNTVSNSTPNYNDIITFTVTVTNNGPCTAQNVSVSEWLSNGYLTYISDDSQGALNLNNGIWTIGTLNSGANSNTTHSSKGQHTKHNHNKHSNLQPHNNTTQTVPTTTKPS